MRQDTDLRAPGLTRGLPANTEAPEQVRGGEQPT